MLPNKLKSYKLRSLFIFFLIFVWIFSGFPVIFDFPQKPEEAKAVAQGDARIVYGQATNATPQTRAYAGGSWGAQGGTAVGTANVWYVVTKASPTANEIIMGELSTTGVLNVFCFDGTTWSKDWGPITIGPSFSFQRFDIAYEKTSGIPMVVYSRNVSGTNEMGYRRKTGSGCGTAAWTGELLIDSARITGTVRWIELEAREGPSGTNVLGMAFTDTTVSSTNGGQLSAMIWDGSAWGNEPATLLSSSTETAPPGGTAGATVRTFDVAFESLSGEMMVLWGDNSGANGTNGARFVTCGATLPCTWSAVTTPPTLADDVTDMDLAADPLTDDIMFGSIGNAGSDLQGGMWNGSTNTWTMQANVDISARTPAYGQTHIAMGWLTDGVNRPGILVYDDGTTGTAGVESKYWTPGGSTFTALANFSPVTAPGVDQELQININPFDRRELLLVLMGADTAIDADTRSEIWVKKLSLAGTTLTWCNTEPGNTGCNTGLLVPLVNDSSTGEAINFGLAYNRFVPAVGGYATFGTYISSNFNVPPLRAWNVLEWSESISGGPCTGCDIRIQIQTSTDGIGWQINWCGPNGVCDGTSFYTNPSGTLIPTLHNAHQWIRYKATFDGDGTNTPILNWVRVNYQPP